MPKTGTPGNILKVLTAALALAAGPGLAVAQETNGSCNGRTQSSDFFIQGLNIYYHGGAHLAGEYTTFSTTGEIPNMQISVQGDQTGTLCSSQASCNGLVFTAPSDGTFTFEISGGGLNEQYTEGASIEIDPISGTVSSVCTPNTTDPEPEPEPDNSSDELIETIDAAAGATGGAATAAIEDAISTALSGADSPVTVSSNGLHFSTGGMGNLGDGMAIWSALGFRMFDGNIDGDGIELSFGAHARVGAATRLGLAVSYGNYGLTVGGNTVTTDAFSYGPYAAIDIGANLQLQGFVVFAQPDYTVSGTSFSTDRVAGGLRLNTVNRIGNVEFDSFVSARGFSEDHPAVVINTIPVAARTISSLTGALGTRATFNLDKPARPFINVAAEFNQFDNGLGTDTDNFSPRIGAGLHVDGEFGDFEIEIEGGELFDGTRDYQARLGFRMEF